MPGVLVFGAVASHHLQGASLEVAAMGQKIARGLGTKLSGALIGSGCNAAAEAYAGAGMANLFVVDDARLAPYLNDIHLAAAEFIIRKCSPTVVLFPQTAETSEWVPRLAARMNAALVTACSNLSHDGQHLIATKPVSGGAVQAEYTFNLALQFAILSPGACTPIQISAPCPIINLDPPDLRSRMTVLETSADAADAGPQLKTARIVVSGGMGVGSRENWAIVQEAANALGAAVGATRAVVELGWAPHSQQVGFSGSKVSPDLYIAVGISGAIHHLAGIAGARTVVAINSDSGANIFRAARFGVIGNANEVMPAFIERVKELRAQKTGKEG